MKDSFHDEVIKFFEKLPTIVDAAGTSGIARARAWRRALWDAGLTHAHVDHVNAHATSTPRGDAAEAAAIARLLQLHDGHASRDVSVTSIKGALGHLLAAAGATPPPHTLSCVGPTRVQAQSKRS